jgi:hypothetical protein
VGFTRRAADFIARLFRPRWHVVEWKSRGRAGQSQGATDVVEVRLDDLAISLFRTASSTLPHEVTVVIPRAEVVKRYEEGRLAETRLVYSSITVSHAPRFPPEGP